MGLCFGFKLNPKFSYTVPIHSPHLFLSSSSSAGGREVFFSPTRLSFLSTIYEEGETLHKDFGKTFAFSPTALEAPQKDILQGGEVTKVNKGKRSLSSVHEMIDNTQLPFGESHFGLLMENLDALEETFADSEALRLKKNIILQLEKLGALELFNVCLTASSGTSPASTCTDGVLEQLELNKRNHKVDDYTGKVVVQSSKRKENRTRRKRASVSIAPSSKSLPLEINQEDPLRSSPAASFVKRSSNTKNTKNRRAMIAQREVEMAKGVKVLAELEKMRTAIEEDTKQAVSMSSWAEASGVNQKALKQQLYHGYYCKDELLRSTRSLVLYFAKKYRGMGIALEDLLQVGYIGVLQGAERFDSTRGYRFSTYVQHWIRKSMSKTVAKYARGITVPWSMNKAINQIKKARKVLRSTSMKYPEDHEIAKMTGLSLDRIISASHCLRTVSSMNCGVEYPGYIPDMSIESPEKTVMKQHIRKDIHDVLQCLDSRERQILILRFGLNDHKPKSLEYIGRIYKVSKAWIWQIEKKALTKLWNETNISKMNYYLDL
ncbi:RNA polymerase sigma factor sigC [Trifolium pratense]|uniref:RNA polymerase sigma factor sigC n=1 Tax=Trifolium pratense TaxID=57577 RepID=UPI001E6925DD|nr:RNA polymerase sigma factor sigC [Trifolium pratense]